MESIRDMAFCYFNGQILEEPETSISIHNLGLHRGFGIFDFFRARNGKPTFFEDYLDRFDRSQEALHLSRRIEKQEIKEAVSSLILKNGFENASFKLILLAQGSETDDSLDPLFYIINSPHPVSPTIQSSNLITHEYVRETPRIKHLNYFPSIQLHERKMTAKAVDVLYYKKGIVSEASRSNVFVIKDGLVKTPERNILHGITRKHILKVLEGGFDYEIADVTLDEVYAADEVFISSTIKEIMPILKVDDRTIGTGNIGPISTQLWQEFRAYIDQLSN